MENKTEQDEDFKDFLRFLGIIVGIIVLVIAGLIGIKQYSDSLKEQYCGVVKERYMTPAGYKVRPEKHIVFYCARTDSRIDVEVTDNTYANTKVEGGVCFSLHPSQTE